MNLFSIVGGYIQELNVGEHTNVLNDKILFSSESFLDIADSLRNFKQLIFYRIFQELFAEFVRSNKNRTFNPWDFSVILIIFFILLFKSLVF